MKNILKTAALVAVVVLASCKKDSVENPSLNSPGYSSLNSFFSQNAVASQIYIVDAVLGGSFTSPQGTLVTIPTNAFLTMNNQPVSGSVLIEFKDIYKKSDMLLSDRPTMLTTGEPMKSGGEFYIKATSDHLPLKLAVGKHIEVSQPAVTGPIDPGMVSFVAQQSSGWLLAPNNTVTLDTAAFFNYIYQMAGLDSGSTWCNSDNSAFFAAYTQTAITLHATTDMAANPISVFLVFQSVNSVIHVYGNGIDFPYSYAPVGLPCSVVATCIKDGKIYYSITPFTVGANMTVNFSLQEVTEAEYLSHLNALN